MKAQCATRQIRSDAIQILEWHRSERRRKSHLKITKMKAKMLKDSWFGLVKGREVTTEEAIEELDRRAEGYRYRWASNEFYKTIYRAETIIHTCDMIIGKYGVGEAIVLEQDDLELFERWTLRQARTNMEEYWSQ